ncbi:MAG: hypothetical protein JWM47_3674 [Acidimicrobiales bacterium]|nr:hypothetical protein [Acidimicrobiales bacterium]
MTVQENEGPEADGGATDGVIRVPRRTIDEVLIGFGLIATFVFAVAAGLLMWGANFSDDYVRRELGSQNVFFPTKAVLIEEGRADLVGRAGQQVTNGPQAEDYASYIGGHLEKIGGGKTYSQIDYRGAADAVVAAKKAGASQVRIIELQATADQLKDQRATLFEGETLRGLLLSAFAWSTVGTIARISAWVAVVAAVVMAAVTVIGVVDLRRTTH